MYVSATGVVCPVGLNAAAACAALRAGLSGLHELPYSDQNRKPVVGAAVPGLDYELPRSQRVLELAGAAIAECLVALPALSRRTVPLLVGLAEPGRPAGGAGLAESIVPRLEHKLGYEFHPSFSRAFAIGHTACFRLMMTARKLLLNPNIPGCLICGVDSYINASSIFWLESHWRLKREDHSNGVIPGEGAAALLLQPKLISKGATAAEVTGLGIAHEGATVLSTEPRRSDGLTAATRAAITEAGLQLQDIDFRISDVTAEDYGFKELSLVVARLQRVLTSSFPHWHCSGSVGDTGAGAGFLQAAIAFDAFRRGYAPGDRAICFTGSPSGDRAVAVLQKFQA